MDNLADSFMRGNRVFLLNPANADVLTGERRTHYPPPEPRKPILKVLIALTGLV